MRNRYGIRCGNCRRSDRWSPNINAIAWCAIPAARQRVPNCRQAFQPVKPGRGWSLWWRCSWAASDSRSDEWPCSWNKCSGQPCSPGWVVKLQNQATAALRPAYEELAGQLPAEEALAIDESPTKEGRVKAWLWTCVAATFTVFTLRTTRAATVLQELLGKQFDGVVNCDRAKMYWSLPRLQWCWAHLKRDFQALIDSDDRQVKRLGHDLMRPTRELFRHWARYRDGTITRTGLKRLMHPIRHEVDSLLLRGCIAATTG